MGARCPHTALTALPQLKPAVDAITGLRGFVGVDFIWNADERHATILEINPRPTTSYVGLSRLAPSRLAGTVRGWPLASRSPETRDVLAGLAELHA